MCYLDTLKKSSKIKETRLKKGIVEELQQPSYGVINKGCLRIREEGVERWGKSGQMQTGGVGWLAKCGRPYEKKIIATILVKFTQINEIFSFSM